MWLAVLAMLIAPQGGAEFTEGGGGPVGGHDDTGGANPRGSTNGRGGSGRASEDWAEERNRGRLESSLVEVSIEVDAARAVLSASAEDEPQWIARSWCEALALENSEEGLPCTRMLAEEFIAEGGRYEVGRHARESIRTRSADQLVSPRVKP